MNETYKDYLKIRSKLKIAEDNDKYIESRRLKLIKANNTRLKANGPINVISDGQGESECEYEEESFENEQEEKSESYQINQGFELFSEKFKLINGVELDCKYYL